MNYEKFFEVCPQRNTLIFKEMWMDRCIDREDEDAVSVYIPSFPYWSSQYNPQSWIDEGFDISCDKGEALLEELVEYINKNNIGKIYHKCALTTNTEYEKEETGYKIYTQEEFLALNHKEMEYEGYVWYGSTYLEIKTNKPEEVKHKLIEFIKSL